MMEGTDGRDSFLRKNLGLGVGMVVAVVHGLASSILLKSFYNTDTVVNYGYGLTFIVVIPVLMGFVTIWLSPSEKQSSWNYNLTRPWVPAVVSMLVAMAIGFEFWFCVCLALPLFMALASVGGTIARFVSMLTKDSNGSKMAALVLLVVAPVLSSRVENLLSTRQVVRTVHSQIEIDAPPEIVWKNITNLEEIPPAEQRVAFFYLVGLPRPVQARMACEEVGCTRRGAWEDGLAFDGTITQIEKGRSYWVTLEADTRDVASARAPLHDIGGPTFDMVDDGYEIEPLSDGRSRLHLYSTYRVQTGYNFYATLWLDFLMKDIQHYILNVEKTRSEVQASLR